MMGRRKKHPGVWIMKRKLASGKIAHRAKYVDPDTEKTVWVTLERLGLTNKDKRDTWAEALSKSLERRRADLAAGIVRDSLTSIEEALLDFTERKKAELAAKTVETYQEGLDFFEKWAEENAPPRVSMLTGPDLARFRAWLVSLPSRKYPKRALAAQTVNRHLRSVKAALNDFRRLGLLPLDSEVVKEALKPLKTTRELPDVFRKAEIRKLLQAALRHDRERFKITRAEHDGERETGTTPRYRPVAGFVATVLLTGARVGEVEALKWQAVDFEEEFIRIKAGKTGIERQVDLRVAPVLKALLARLKLEAGENEYVFGGDKPWPRTLSESSRKRLIRTFGAPMFGWQKLRRTCSAYLVCSPSIFGAASAFLAAKQLGHSVTIAEKHYTGLLRGISPEHKTLEASMGVEGLVGGIAGTSAEESASEALIG